MSMTLTDEEEMLVQNYILLPLAIKVVEHDLDHLGKSKLKFKSPYRMLLEQIRSQLYKELSEIKKNVFKQKMRFYRKSELSYEVWVRGWKHNIGYHPTVASTWVESRMTSKFNIDGAPEFKYEHDSMRHVVRPTQR
ncbi:hypothetical protein JOD43_002096 [Pullulanibacillus pueri]|uniref:Uncharacterized protein n=1 Tax=Pullulanibacillus pueri TaxID=1437324 RepID=A0A8J2ZWW3_9BACL|nr:hypothetical protein [Pullulanibacillus pueri]MBM7681924.1 hypothetical protein [Pullulanibacillus pueri]GGH83464.1 hypothetical protein GCM10007096_24370 [Pullulanibacillus pueri]